MRDQKESQNLVNQSEIEEVDDSWKPFIILVYLSFVMILPIFIKIDLGVQLKGHSSAFLVFKKTFDAACSTQPYFGSGEIPVLWPKVARR